VDFENNKYLMKIGYLFHKTTKGQSCTTARL